MSETTIKEAHKRLYDYGVHQIIVEFDGRYYNATAKGVRYVATCASQTLGNGSGDTESEALDEMIADVFD